MERESVQDPQVLYDVHAVRYAHGNSKQATDRIDRTTWVCGYSCLIISSSYTGLKHPWNQPQWNNGT